MFHPIPGGSSQVIEFGDEKLEVHLPPVGYVIDKMPDPKTGKPSEKLIKSEILFNDLPVKDQKWTKTQFPKNWERWIEEEKSSQEIDPNYTHPDLDHFRAQEWRRRINGVWIAIGNNQGKPTEYIYLTGFGYFYLAWWYNGYETRFRFVLLRIFYVLEWSEENPASFGVIFSTLRRLGKTAIAYCYLFELPSRMRYRFGGSQAQKEDVAQEFYLKFLVGPFMNLPEFFVPKHDNSGQLKNGIRFQEKVVKGKKSNSNFTKKKSLNGDITFKETKSNAYDKAKLHRYIVEEPGKWVNDDIYSTFNKVKPALKDGHIIIGQAFLPTTVEELELGGDAFIKLFEDSLPSHMKKYDGETKSGLIALFISAPEGFLFDQYGRSVIDDPPPHVELFNDLDGKRILEGSKTQLMKARKRNEHDIELLTIEMRQYPWSWEEAKSMSNQFCHFNHMLLTTRLNQLQALPKPRFTVGNFEWTNGKDSDVDFFPDSHKGKWKVSWLPDEKGDGGHGPSGHKISNNVGWEWDGETQKKLYRPLNDHLFAMGVDPIRNIQTDDPTASKAAMYIFMKYNALWDTGVPPEKWRSYRFVVEYLVRPDDPEDFHEDMIKTCRYWGVSMFEEGNVETLRQHFIFRGYGAFLVNRGQFTDFALPGVKKDGANADKAVRTDVVVTHNVVDKLKMYYNRHVDKVDFPLLLEGSLKFRIKKHFKKDAVFGAGYTLISSERSFSAPVQEEEVPLELEAFPLYDNHGTNSRQVSINEFEWKQ